MPRGGHFFPSVVLPAPRCDGDDGGEPDADPRQRRGLGRFAQVQRSENEVLMLPAVEQRDRIRKEYLPCVQFAVCCAAARKRLTRFVTMKLTSGYGAAALGALSLK